MILRIPIIFPVDDQRAIGRSSGVRKIKAFFHASLFTPFRCTGRVYSDLSATVLEGTITAETALHQPIYHSKAARSQSESRRFIKPTSLSTDTVNPLLSRFQTISCAHHH